MSRQQLSRAQAIPAQRILIVDDEPAIRSVYARTLQNDGYATLEAATGEEALAVIDNGPVALALIDRVMPGLGGDDLIRTVRQREETRNLPIIITTGLSSPLDRVGGLEVGADDYLTKPIVLQELLARVRAQLRIHAIWSESFTEEHHERRMLISTLRRVQVGGSAELAASSIADELSAALGGVPVGVFSFVDLDGVIPLASAGLLEGPHRPGLPLPPLEAKEIRRRSVEGPWFRHASALAGTTSSRGALEAFPAACLPLHADGEQVGLLVIGVGSSADGSATGMVRRLAQYSDLADIVSALLRPSLEDSKLTGAARAAIEQLIANRSFVPHFQPIVRLTDGAVLGYEALTRFDDGSRPDVRFAEASRLGLGHELEIATLQASVAAAATLPPERWLSLNVSPALLMADMTLGAVMADADRPVIIELTEHARIADYAALLARIGKLGPSVRVAVDDAGSGYASLRHILALRPDFIKLDISWVSGLDGDPARQALVAGLTHFARETVRDLIGEGIETEAERATLIKLGVPYGQGYLFGRPLPAPGSLHGS